MYPPDVIQFNMACLTADTEKAEELRQLADTLLEKYKDDEDICMGIGRNLNTLDYRVNHEKKYDSRPGHRIFTPRDPDTGERLQFYVSDEDRDKVIRGPGYKGVVTDIETGEQWKVWGASCGIQSCYCDAIVRKA